MSDGATYGRVFAELYNRRWAWFSERAAPKIEAFYDSTSLGRCNRSMLDVCCGTGQLAVFFLERGFSVVGVDSSPYMLAHAGANAAQWVEAGTARFVQADAADFDVGRGFGLAVSTYDALNHLSGMDALAACFGCVHAALADDGWFLFDLNTELAFRTRWNGISVQDDEEAMIVSRSVYDAASKRAFTKLSGFVRSQDGRYDRFEELVPETAFGLKEVEHALRATGFVSVAFADGADPQALTEEPEAKTRVFVVAGK
jgi:SAM-dependent methyltransferase